MSTCVVGGFLQEDSYLIRLCYITFICHCNHASWKKILQRCNGVFLLQKKILISKFFLRSYVSVLIFFVLLTAIVFLVYYYNQYPQTEKSAQEVLSLITKLKGDQISNWYDERIKDAAFVSSDRELVYYSHKIINGSYEKKDKKGSFR
jgi:lysylphosphatidylglycerol synthetase-like protein (DUF2156 family)